MRSGPVHCLDMSTYGSRVATLGIAARSARRGGPRRRARLFRRLQASGCIAGNAALRAPDGDCGPLAASMVNAFSPLALLSVAVLLVTGAFAAWEQLGSLAALFTSRYGRTLLVKLGAVAAVAASGALNWRVLRPVNTFW